MRLKQDSHLGKLDPYLSEDDIILEVEIRRANLPKDLVHQVVLPTKCHVIEVIMKYYHDRTCHARITTILNELRASGFGFLKQQWQYLHVYGNVSHVEN